MKDLNKQIDDVLAYLMNAPTTPAERSKLILQFSKQVKARHRFKLKSQPPAKPTPPFFEVEPANAQPGKNGSDCGNDDCKSHQPQG